MDILTNFGVQPLLLLAQIVNFLILLFILKKFLYSPLLKVLHERKTRIEQGLKDAEEAQRKLTDATLQIEKMMQKQAELDKEASEQRDRERDELIKQARDEASKIISEAQPAITQQLKASEERIRQQLREEASEMIALGLQKVVGKVLTKKDRQDLLDKSIKEIH